MGSRSASPADSIVDKLIPTFSRGELQHSAGIHTFLEAPYVEDVRPVRRRDDVPVRYPLPGPGPGNGSRWETLHTAGVSTSSSSPADASSAPEVR